MTKHAGVILVWYLHLPTITPDEEVGLLVRDSIRPLVRAHEESGAPLNLALTGTLLERLQRLAPSVVVSLQRMLEVGQLCLGATFYHEVLPAVVPLSRLRAQLELDVAQKRGLFGAPPAFFHPPGFCWVVALEWLLADLGIERVLLDERHLIEACRTQTWRWLASEGERLSAVMRDAYAGPHEALRPFGYAATAQRSGLSLLFRSWQYTKTLTFGSTGSLHRPLEPEQLDASIEALRSHVAKGALITVADDGDRINPISLSSYAHLLESLGEDLLRVSDVEHASANRGELGYLPSFTLGSLRDFWLADSDALHYLTLLAELSAARKDKPPSPEILELDDVYPLFWKNLGRKRAYFDRVIRLIEAERRGS